MREIFENIDYVVKDTGYKTACHIWIRCLNPQGYAWAGHNGSYDLVINILYKLKHKFIPFKKELDHLCNIKACINLEHIEPVSHSENIRRGMRYNHKIVSPQLCKRGHLLTEDNVYYNKTFGRESRACKQCVLERAKRKTFKFLKQR
jgi:hypothetical protein